MRSEYRCEAATAAGFVRQLAVSYVGHGYWFYVTGQVPERKAASSIDGKLITKYGIGVSRATRSRRKLAGNANVHYLRHGRFFVLLATHGKHNFFEEERTCIRDIREVPIKFGGYSIGYRGGHPSVRIEDKVYRDLKAYFLDQAAHRDAAWMERGLGSLHFEPYAPVRRQLLAILRAVNERRAESRFDPISKSCLRLGRYISKPFGGSSHPRTSLGGPPVELFEFFE